MTILLALGTTMAMYAQTREQATSFNKSSFQAKEGESITYTGTIDRIDVQADPGQRARFQAYFNPAPGTGKEILLETNVPELRSALEAASIKRVSVEVTLAKSENGMVLTRVKHLDPQRKEERMSAKEGLADPAKAKTGLQPVTR